MNIEAWTALISLAVVLLGSLVAIVARFVRVETKLESHDHDDIKKIPEIVLQMKNLESRVEEDRSKNTEQHKDFYDFRRETEPVQAEILQQLTGIVNTQARILDKLDEMERRIK